MNSVLIGFEIPSQVHGVGRRGLEESVNGRFDRLKNVETHLKCVRSTKANQNIMRCPGYIPSPNRKSLSLDSVHFFWFALQ
jgi:hypothetical protein